jgi:hypothetical protein
VQRRLGQPRGLDQPCSENSLSREAITSSTRNSRIVGVSPPTSMASTCVEGTIFMVPRS